MTVKMIKNYSAFIQNVEIPTYLFALSIMSYELFDSVLVGAYFLFWCLFRLAINLDIFE